MGCRSRRARWSIAPPRSCSLHGVSWVRYGTQTPQLLPRRERSSLTVHRRRRAFTSPNAPHPPMIRVIHPSFIHICVWPLFIISRSTSTSKAFLVQHLLFVHIICLLPVFLAHNRPARRAVHLSHCPYTPHLLTFISYSPRHALRSLQERLHIYCIPRTLHSGRFASCCVFWTFVTYCSSPPLSSTLRTPPAAPAILPPSLPAIAIAPAPIRIRFSCVPVWSSGPVSLAFFWCRSWFCVPAHDSPPSPSPSRTIPVPVPVPPYPYRIAAPNTRSSSSSGRDVVLLSLSVHASVYPIGSIGSSR